MSQTNMWQIEEGFFDQGIKLIAGIDEAGRGPLAGPVCAAAVILPPFVDIPGLNDSKKLSDKQRRALLPLIKEKALAYGIAFATESEIDEINILQATYLAMQRAVSQLAVKPDLLLIDGNRKCEFGIEAVTVVHGDSLSASIAAASVIAKVTRDRMMVELDKEYPEYGFAKHKGYPTKLHLEMIKKYGILDNYRFSYKPVMKVLEEMSDIND